MSQNNKDTLKVVATEITGIPVPQKINRESFEYKLAKYYYHLWRQEKQDHDITKQEAQAAEMALHEYSSAYEGMDRGQMTAGKIADDRVTSILAACDDIDTLRKKKKDKMFTFGKNFAIAVIALVIIWQFFTNTTVRQELLDKAIPLAILLGVIVFAYYIFTQKRK
ncbi:MAG: hypothetical protein WC325_11080 [Candidatus Bathyarchaeia archaeon]|jgi:hypothetical protein